VAAQLAASQGGLGSMELVSHYLRYIASDCRMTDELYI
jgi:hypothetical protein